MSCGSEYETQNCITDTLLAIVEAQDKVEPCKDEETGCERAIKELKSGNTKSLFNTIPIILQLKCSGKPFVGHSGVREKGSSKFSIVCSSIFRVIDVDPENNCASLELLRSNSKMPYVTETDSTSTSSLCDMHNKGLTGTEAFITVDLSSFASVSCLPPVTLN
ncbi:CotY/CotZ family spore coat protein [Pradoshia sp.]